MQLTLKQAAGRSGLSAGFLKLLCRTGALGHVRDAGMNAEDGITIAADDFDAFLVDSKRESRRFNGSGARSTLFAPATLAENETEEVCSYD